MSLLFSPNGRIPRHVWWIGVVILIVANLVAGLILGKTLGTAAIFTFGGRFVVFLVSLVFLYVAFCLASKRFQDRDRPGSLAGMVAGFGLLKLFLDLGGVTGDPWALNGLDYVFLVAQVAIGIWFIVELGCMAGTQGKNRYGPDPLEHTALPYRHGRPAPTGAPTASTRDLPQ